MGREIKRVPLDFNWPLNEVWKGFLNPFWEYRRECTSCNGSGYSPEAKRISDQWYGWDAHFDPSMTGSTPFSVYDEFVTMLIRAKIERTDTAFYTQNGLVSLEQAVRIESVRMCQIWNSSWSHHLEQADVQALINSNRLWDFTREFIPGEGWRDRNPSYIPTAKEVNYWSLSGMGHDSLNHWICVRAKCERLGYSLDCKRCDDGGIWPKGKKEAYENWQKEEPPTGEGWQVWETVSEGSPISPVFATGEGLENWLISEGYSEGAAEQFIKSAWVPSLLMVDGKMYSDIESLQAR